MRPKTLDTPVPESLYAADLVLLEKYQSYSAELLRLSLALLAGYGVVLKLSLQPEEQFFHVLVDRWWLLVLNLVALGASAAAAVAIGTCRQMGSPGGSPTIAGG